MTVYLIQDPPKTGRGWKPDLSTAKKFGEIVEVLGENDQPSQHPKECREKVLQALEKFDAKKDFLLWAGGDAMAMFLAGSVLEELAVFEYQYLRWDRKVVGGERKGGRYVPVQVKE